MVEADLFLEKLPAQLSASVEVIPGLNRSLLLNALNRLIEPNNGLREQFVLRQYQLAIRFGINKSKTGQLSFFFKRKKRKEEVVMDVKVRLAIQAVPEMLSLMEQAVMPFYFYWKVPPFLLMDATERQALIDTLPGPGPKHPLVLTDNGGQFLLIDFENSHAAPKTSLWFNSKAITVAGNGLWDAEPFFVIYRSIREWLAGLWQEDTMVALNLGNDKDISQVIRTIALGFTSSRKSLLSQGQDTPTDHWLWDAIPPYDIKNYHCDVLLRLDEEGDLALVDSPRSFQLGLAMELHEIDRHYEALIGMQLPDFLIKGDLYEAFWGIFLDYDESPKIRKELSEKANKKGYNLSEEAIFDLLQQARDGQGSVFRMDREKNTDVNVFIISGTFKEEDIHLVFSGQFEVESVHPPDVVFKGKQRLEVHYWPEQNQIDQPLVNYFLRIVKYFKRWEDLLQ